MIDFSTKFPKNANNVYWQKKKSFKDKTKKATKTGLGAELTKAEKAWNAIPWKQLDFRTVKPKPKTIQEAKQALATAKQIQSTQVRAAIKATESAIAKAKTTGRNKALSVRAHDIAYRFGKPYGYQKAHNIADTFRRGYERRNRGWGGTTGSDKG